MRLSFNSLLFLMGALPILLITSPANAVPAFARQMNASCDTCHFQHFPMLNTFGRVFKANGFTMTSASLIETSDISVPSNLNAAIFSNLRYQQSNGPKEDTAHTSNDGEWILPGETSLFVGGRVSPNMGALIEGDVGSAGAGDGAIFLASIKMPIVFSASDNVHIGIVPFSAGLGPAYAYETLNTGAVGNHFMNLVHTTSMSASQYVQIAYSQDEVDDNIAEGIGAYAASSDYFVTLAAWSHNHGSVDVSGASASPTSNYFRVAYTPQIGAWDTGFGIQYFGGASNAVESATSWTRFDTRAWAVDAQMQGMLSNMPLGIYLGYAQAPHSAAGDPINLYNPYSEKKTAASIAIEVGAFAHGKGSIQAGYRAAKTGNATYDTDNATTLGLSYLPWNNVQLAVFETWYSGNAHSKAALNSGDSYGLGALVDASGSGDMLTSVNLAVGF
jgi:hypothetical protein